MADLRSVELQIRATDLSGKTIKDVRKNINELKTTLEAQAKASLRGKTDFKKYEQGLKDLAAAADKLVSLQGIAGKLGKMNAAYAEQSDKLKAASKAYDDLSEKIGKTGVPTKAQATQLERLHKAQSKMAESAEKAKNAYEAQRIVAEQYGINTKNISAAQEELNKSHQRTLQTIINLRNAKNSLLAQNAIGIRDAQAEQANIKRNNELLRKNIQLWQENVKAIRAARAEAAKNQQGRNEALNQQRLAEQRLAEQQAILQSRRNVINASKQPLSRQIITARNEADLVNTSNSARISNSLRGNNLAGAMTNIAASVRASQTAIRGSVRDVQQLTDKIKALREVQKQMIAVASNIDAFKKQSEVMHNLKAEYAALHQKYHALNNAMREGNATEAQVRQLDNLVARLNKVGSAYAKQKVTVAALARTLSASGVNVDKLAQAESRLTANATRSAAAMKGLERNLVAVAASGDKSALMMARFGNSSRSALGFMQRLRGQIIALTSAYFGLNGVIQLFKQAIESGQEGMVLKIRTEVLADNWKTSADDLEAYFRGTAERMGLVLSDVIQDASKLFVAAKENGFDVKEAQYVYEQFAGLGQLMGADAETQKGITKALSDMFSKGTIQAEELKGQLGDRLPQALALFSKATGKSNAELLKMMENGELTAEYILKAAKVIETQYGSQMEKMYHSLAAEQARANNAWKDWLRIISDAGVLENFKSLLVQITDFLRSEEGKQWALNIAAALNKVIDALKWCVDHVNLLVIAFGALMAVGAVQAFASMAIAVRMLVANIGIALKTMGNIGAKFGLVSTNAAAAGVGIRGFVNGIGGLVKGLARAFIIFEAIAAIIKGVVRGFERATGSTIELNDVLGVLGDVFFLIGEVIGTVSEVIGTVFEGVSENIATVTEFIVGLFTDAEESADKSNDNIADSFKDGAKKSESTWVKTLRAITKGLDALRWAAKSIVKYMVGWFTWGFAKIKGEAAVMPEFAKIAEEVAGEVAKDGAEARLEQHLKEQDEAKKQNRPFADKTQTPEERAIAKRQEELAKLDEKVQKAREKAENARRKAEEEALKRLEKELSYEKMIQTLIDRRNGKNTDPSIGRHKSLGDWYRAEYNKIKAQYAGNDPYADVATTKEEEAANTQLEAANLQLQAAQTRTTGTANSYNGGKTVQTPIAKSLAQIKGAANGSSAAKLPSELAISGGASAFSKINAAADTATKQTTRALNGQVKAVTDYTGKCARYVNDAFRKAGFVMQGNGADVARNAINSKQGFQEVKYDANYVPQKGDIMSLPRGFGQSSKYGHVAVFNGTHWVSDAVQRVRGNTAATNDVSWANIKSGKSKPTIARYTGVNGGIITSSSQKAPVIKTQSVSVENSGSRQDKALAYYQNQTKRYERELSNTKQSGRDYDVEEKIEQLNARVKAEAAEALKDLYKAIGVNGVEGLINRKPEDISVDLSNSTLDEIIDGFKNLMQPDIDNKIAKSLELIALDYASSKGGTIDEALEWSKQFEPQMRKYAELSAQKEMEGAVDAFTASMDAERKRMEEEFKNMAEYVASATSRGAMAVKDGQDLIATHSQRFADGMATARAKLDELVNSKGFSSLSGLQQAAILNQREQLNASSAKSANNPQTIAADAAIKEHVNAINAFIQSKDDYIHLLNNMQASGAITVARREQLEMEYLSKAEAKMKSYTETSRELMLTLGDKASVENLAELAAVTDELNSKMQQTEFHAKFMNETYQQLGKGAEVAFDAVAKGIAGMITGEMNAKEALQNLTLAFAQWAAETLQHLAKVILQQYISYALSSALGMGSGAGLGSVASGALANLFHTGGLVDGGGRGMNKRVNPLVFKGATRYHSGGIAGLAPNEVPAILQKGEEVLTADNPRHRNNYRSGGQTDNGGITLINTFDPVDAVEKALASTRGRKVLVKAWQRERSNFK